MKNKKMKLSEAINDADYVDYGFWLLFERFQVDALQPEFFDVNPDGVKTGPWCFYAICPKDLGVTSRELVRIFLEQLWFEFVPVFHGLQGRFAA